MKRVVRVTIVLSCLVALLAACSGQERVKLRDLEAVILSEELIPEELMDILEEKKAQPFQLTYADQGKLYICIGYGTQETGGYSVVLDDLYLTESAVYISTTLLGPDVEAQSRKTPTCPMIVVETELVEQPVIFE